MQTKTMKYLQVKHHFIPIHKAYIGYMCIKLSYFRKCDNFYNLQW